MAMHFGTLLVVALACFGLVSTRNAWPMSNRGQRRSAEGTQNSVERFKSDCSSCGLENFSGLHDMIINGKVVRPENRYPWMVSLQTIEGEHTCGGALISQQHILTAAHCLDPLAYIPENLPDEKMKHSDWEKTNYVTPELLVIAFLTPTAHELKSRSPVKRIFPHPKYSDIDKKNDIAIIQLKHKIKCDKYANPICLPSSRLQLKENTITSITGWGAAKEGSQTPVKELRQGQLKTANFGECRRLAKREECVKSLEDTVYCLYGVDNITACLGDSGGSMFAEYEKKAYSLGVASLHIDALCSIASPVVYTAIPQYMDWITEVTGLQFYRPTQEYRGLNPLTVSNRKHAYAIDLRTTMDNILKGKIFWNFFS